MSNESTQNSLRKYRSASLAALLALLPVNGYVWSFPITPSMLALAGGLLVLGIVALFLVIYYFDACDKEIARLSESLEKKSAQVMELVEAEREDDRIIGGLTDRLNQVKATLVHNEFRHIDGDPQIVFPEERSSETLSSIAPIVEHPRIYSPQEFRLLATMFARVAVRYERQFTVIRVKMNIEDRQGAIGPEKTADEVQIAIKVIGNTLRTSDFAAVEGSDSIVIGYPETSVTHVDAIMSRLRDALKSSEARELVIELDRKEDAEKTLPV